MLGIVEQEKRSISAQSLLLIPALIWMLLVFALAGPRWVGEPRPVAREGYNIMMALGFFRQYGNSRYAITWSSCKSFDCC